MLDALETAAARGATVRVLLEGAPFGDPDGTLARHNRAVADELQRCGARVALAHVSPGFANAPPVHVKAIVAGGRAFFDDRNWCADDMVIADSDRRDVGRVEAAISGTTVAEGARLAMHKRAALEREAEVLRRAVPGDEVVVESESFGYANPVYSALDALAKKGMRPRLLVTAREAVNPRERAALTHLSRDGVRVALTSATEKCALAGRRAWVGSANASPVFGAGMLDWGLRASDRATVDAVGARVEAHWRAAHPFRAATPAA